MGCCESCDNGGPCDCGGNCNGSCGKSPNNQTVMGAGPLRNIDDFYQLMNFYYNNFFDSIYNQDWISAEGSLSDYSRVYSSHKDVFGLSKKQKQYLSDRLLRMTNALKGKDVLLLGEESSSEGEAYEAVMGGPITDNIRNNTKLWKKGDKLFVRFHNPEWNGTIVVSVPFAPIVTFCQNLAMLYGRPETRSSTVSGYAPIIALVASQLASKKIQEETDKKDGKEKAATKSPAEMGPIDLASLLKMFPISMVGVSYDDSDMGDSRRSMRKSYRAPFNPCDRDPDSVACRLSRKFSGRQSLSGEEENEIIMGACGCGVPCDGIQADSPYMAPRRVVKRASAWTPFYTKKVNSFWRNSPLVNDQASNHFGRSKSAPPSATPPHGWPNRPVESINMKLPPEEGQPAQVSGWRMDGYGTDDYEMGSMPYGNGSFYNPDMGLDCSSSLRNTPACRRYHPVMGEHGIEYVEEMEEEQVPCAKGGTCGKSCCG